ncbi:nitrous oxide reductase family maturation protein NosD [Kitasatospora indigofera]|uniref:right-handed parallel beta-helix repeat-containing protein n=1 Tax=Kitasatospora indigofera TaxID=67307 RepID=UPI00365FA6C7
MTVRRTTLRAAVPVALAAALLTAPVSAQAAPAHPGGSYFVAPGGSATNPGTLTRPFANINQFMAVARPGDTVYVRGGTYTIGETYLSKSGTAGHDITIRNFPGETPVLDGGGTSGVAFFFGEAFQGAGNGSYVTIDGFVIRDYWRSGINIGCCTLDGTVYKNVSHVTVRNNVIDRTGQNGITFMGASDITVEHNLVGRTGWDPTTGSWSSGINMFAMYGTDNLVNGNVTYHNVDVSDHHTDGNGIIVDETWGNGGVTITNNVAFENGGSGIQLTNSGKATIVNNTVYENSREPSYIIGGTGIGFWGPLAVDHDIVRNNLVQQTAGTGLRASEPFTDSVLADNDISGQDGYRQPQFADPEHADFRLRRTSPGVDAGGRTDAPGDALGFDPGALLRTTENQPMPWYRYAPDFTYITRPGGVARLFHSGHRPLGTGVDQGAFETVGPARPPVPPAGDRG